jgi:hypothetical protein
MIVCGSLLRPQDSRPQELFLGLEIKYIRQKILYISLLYDVFLGPQITVFLTTIASADAAYSYDPDWDNDSDKAYLHVPAVARLL